VREQLLRHHGSCSLFPPTYLFRFNYPSHSPSIFLILFLPYVLLYCKFISSSPPLVSTLLLISNTLLAELLIDHAACLVRPPPHRVETHLTHAQITSVQSFLSLSLYLSHAHHHIYSHTTLVTAAAWVLGLNSLISTGQPTGSNKQHSTVRRQKDTPRVVVSSSLTGKLAVEWNVGYEIHRNIFWLVMW
jgi:hypothetical protein